MMRAFPDNILGRERKKPAGKDEQRYIKMELKRMSNLWIISTKVRFTKQLINFCTTIIFLNADRQNAIYTQLEK